MARLDALTEESANRRTELAAKKQRQGVNRRWAIGAATAVSAIVSAVAAVIVDVQCTERENSESARHLI